MGGAVALHTAFNVNNNLAGVFTLSSFLNMDSSVFSNLAKLNVSQLSKLPKLLMYHGDSDKTVLYSCGKYAYDKLTELGVKAEFKTVPHLDHDIKFAQLIEVQKWIVNILPPLTTDLPNKL